MYMCVCGEGGVSGWVGGWGWCGDWGRKGQRLGKERAEIGEGKGGSERGSGEVDLKGTGGREVVDEHTLHDKWFSL